MYRWPSRLRLAVRSKVCYGLGAASEGRTMRARGTGSVYPRGSVWWVKYYDAYGHVHRESSGSKRQADAERLNKKRLAEVAAGARLVGHERERTTFDDLERAIADDYGLRRRKTLDSVLQSFRALRRSFGGWRACDIGYQELASYTARRLEERKPATVRRELVLLRRSMVLAHRAGRLAIVPAFPTIAVDNARSGFFEDEQWRSVRAHLPAHLQDVGDFAFLTDWRLMEILTLRWASLDLTRGVVSLPGRATKNGRARAFPFSEFPELGAIIARCRVRTDEAQRAGRIVPFVFHDKGEPLFGADGRAKRSLRRGWRRACAAVGLPGRILHDFRRTAVRNLERAGMPRSVAMELVGHRTESVYQRYDIVSEKDLTDGVKTYAAWLARA
jgi:integrase